MNFQSLFGKTEPGSLIIQVFTSLLLLNGELTFHEDPKSKNPAICKLFKKLLDTVLPTNAFTTGTLNSVFNTKTLYPSNLLKLYPLKSIYSPKI
ncbi:MAG: hypothetical protein Ct9H90mP3_4130 [Flammeovirgaceae bacterium]|nr:MAG: hypothetical protein Ct9H90mP3_4130 [Flammeovirgaceae bacterium]